jgi:hypothetical protein
VHDSGDGESESMRDIMRAVAEQDEKTKGKFIVKRGKTIYIRVRNNNTFLTETDDSDK